jgi:hypothetical protein
VATREKAAVTEKLATLQAGQAQAAAIAVQVGDLQKALATLQAGQPTSPPVSGSDPAVQGRVRNDPRSLEVTSVGALQSPTDNPVTKRAETLLQNGDVSAARLILERAARDGDPRAVFLLAETYDPQVLKQRGVIGIRGNAAKAEELYALARTLENEKRDGPSSVSRR